MVGMWGQLWVPFAGYQILSAGETEISALPVCRVRKRRNNRGALLGGGGGKILTPVAGYRMG